MMGVIGYHKPQFSLIGDTVNFTSRHCTTGIPGHIMISELAWERATQHGALISKVWKSKKIDTVMKGKGEVPVYHIFLKNYGKFKEKLFKAIDNSKGLDFSGRSKLQDLERFTKGKEENEITSKKNLISFKNALQKYVKRNNDNWQEVIHQKSAFKRNSQFNSKVNKKPMNASNVDGTILKLVPEPIAHRRGSGRDYSWSGHAGQAELDKDEYKIEYHWDDGDENQKVLNPNKLLWIRPSQSQLNQVFLENINALNWGKVR
jgi:hypothetical protein